MLIPHFLKRALFFAIGCSLAWAQVARSPSEPQLPGQSPGPVPTPGPALTMAQSPFQGSVVQGQPTADVLPLSITDALDRGLKYNLGGLLAAQGERSALATRWRSLAALLPTVTGRVVESSQIVNLAALGFSGFPGVPQIIGPFQFFDARVQLTQSVLNVAALFNARAGAEGVAAARFSTANARDTIALVTVALYLQAAAGSARVEAVQAQVATAEALFNRARDQKAAGTVPGIEVLRAQVELQAQQQRLIFFENEFEKEKLGMARAIGLPLGQRIRLTDAMPQTPLPSVTLEEALARAFKSRPDLQGSEALVRSAQLQKRAAESERYPSIGLNADFGTIGQKITQNHGTYTAAIGGQIPIYLGGRTKADILQADAQVEQRRAEHEDLRGSVEFDVRTALLDLGAAGRQVDVARSAIGLATDQLQQAQDRFAAGVASNIEVVQAQEAVATANDNLISSLLAWNLGKASLAKAVGNVESTVKQYLGGK